MMRTVRLKHSSTSQRTRSADVLVLDDLVLDEADLGGALAKALTAHVDAVLAHQTVLVAWEGFLAKIEAVMITTSLSHVPRLSLCTSLLGHTVLSSSHNPTLLRAVFKKNCDRRP